MLDLNFSWFTCFPLFYTQCSVSIHSASNSYAASCGLIVLALPLEAKSPVDKELADERDKGHDDGDAVDISDHHDPTLRGGCDLPEDDDCGRD